MISYSKCNTPKEMAEVAWFFAFNHAPYTNFNMIDMLCKKANITYAQMWQDPQVLKKRLTKADIYSLAKTLTSKHSEDSNFGRCTSFAEEVSYSLTMQRQAPLKQRFDFQFYDMGKHRLALCKNTGLLIDSSSSTGPMFLSENEWKSFQDQPGQPKWYSAPNLSRTKRLGRDGSTVLEVSIRDFIWYIRRVLTSFIETVHESYLCD